MIITKDKKYNDIIKWCLEDILKMDNYKVNIKYGKIEGDGRGEMVFPNTVKINKNLDKSWTVQALIHELRHYFQKKTKMFDFLMTIEEEAAWKSTSEGFLMYWNKPWEKDSRKFTTETYKKYQKKFKKL